MKRSTSGDRSRATSGDRSRAPSGDRSRATPRNRSRAISGKRSHPLFSAFFLLLTALSISCGPAVSGTVPVVEVPGAEPAPSVIERVSPVVIAPEKPKPIAWETSEIAARERAKARGMPIVVFLFAQWAAAAVRMDRTTWSDPRVMARATSFVPLRLDVTDTDANAQADADRFDLKAMPSTVILDERGREVARIDGFAGPDELLTAMDRMHPTGD